MTCRGMAAALLLAVSWAGAAHGQETSDAETDRWLVGGSIGVPGYGGDVEPSLFTIAVHGARVRRGRIGPEVFVGTMPRALFEGVLAVGARSGLAWAVPVSENVLLMPSGGVSFVGGIGPGGGGAELGVNVGLSAAAVENSSGGFRVGITWHTFPGLGGSLWLLEFGFIAGR